MQKFVVRCALILILIACVSPLAGKTQQPPASAPPLVLKDDVWTRLDTVPYPGKQDDIVFASPSVGWYGNGSGKVYRTDDGGASWKPIWTKPGTFVRALGFVDENIGILGNIGTDYFPGVTDTQPIYRTEDGGRTWSPITAITGPAVKGICAIDVFREPFINAGHLNYRTTIRAGGRVGGPAFLLQSSDLGLTWTSRDMNALTAMILDIKFIDAKTGFIAGATSGAVDKSHALVLKTSDGGITWRRVYESTRPWELTWKLSFPTDRVGYVTVQNYDPDPSNVARFVAKTTDGGETWTEIPLVSDHAESEFGIGFLDASHGWVGGLKSGYETRDGGATWTPVEMGRAVNKIRIVKSPGGTTVYAIGTNVYARRVGPTGK